MPLRMARHRPTITSSLMFSMIPAASPATNANKIGAGRGREGDREKNNWIIEMKLPKINPMARNSHWQEVTQAWAWLLNENSFSCRSLRAPKLSKGKFIREKRYWIHLVVKLRFLKDWARSFKQLKGIRKTWFPIIHRHWEHFLSFQQQSFSLFCHLWHNKIPELSSNNSVNVFFLVQINAHSKCSSQWILFQCAKTKLGACPTCIRSFVKEGKSSDNVPRSQKLSSKGTYGVRNGFLF